MGEFKSGNFEASIMIHSYIVKKNHEEYRFCNVVDLGALKNARNWHEGPFSKEVSKRCRMHRERS